MEYINSGYAKGGTKSPGTVSDEEFSVAQEVAEEWINSSENSRISYESPGREWITSKQLSTLLNVSKRAASNIIKKMILDGKVEIKKFTLERCDGQKYFAPHYKLTKQDAS